MQILNTQCMCPQQAIFLGNHVSCRPVCRHFRPTSTHGAGGGTSGNRHGKQMGLQKLNPAVESPMRKRVPCFNTLLQASFNVLELAT